jgi:sugar O-acyltransferase (sialic acid O-acetyltransferase NeuD family)
MKDIAIYGAGGFGREVACIIMRINKIKPTWNLVGFYDDDISLVGSMNEYGKILGGIDELHKCSRELSLVIAIGSVEIIKTIVEQIKNPYVNFPNIIDPSVDFLDNSNVRLGKGNLIFAKCFISCNIEIGNFNIFNASVGIGHDTIIGNFNVIMPNVNISGGVKIGDFNMCGVKSTILQNIVVGNNVKLGANSLLMRNTKNDCLYIGTPAKIFKY